MREEVVAVQGQHWGLGVDSVLAGHEGWVSNEYWARLCSHGSTEHYYIQC